MSCAPSCHISVTTATGPSLLLPASLLSVPVIVWRKRHDYQSRPKAMYRAIASPRTASSMYVTEVWVFPSLGPIIYHWQNNHYTVLCAKFFDTKCLFAALHKAKNGTYDRMQVDQFLSSSRAIYYHESLHWVGLTGINAYPDMLRSLSLILHHKSKIKVWTCWWWKLSSLRQSWPPSIRHAQNLRNLCRCRRGQDIQCRRNGACLYDSTLYRAQTHCS